MSTPKVRESFNIDNRGDCATRESSNVFGRTWTTAWFNNNNNERTHSTASQWSNVEDDWSKKLLDDAFEIKKKGVQGDIPAPDGFASEGSFWQVMMLAASFGAILGFFSIFFLMCVEKVPKMWVHNSDFESFDDVNFNSGKQYYVYITGGAGLLVGLIRLGLGFPETIPGIFKEIEHYRVNPTWAPASVLISAISLAAGASLGPEQALGNLGGGLATYITDNYFEFETPNKNLVVLCGMCAAFGGLFPTPVLAVLIIYELGKPPKSFMETVVCLSTAALAAFSMYYRFSTDFYLDHMTSNGQVIAAQWNFGLEQCGTGFVFGLISGAICVIAVVMMGVVKQILFRIKDKLNLRRENLGTVVVPMIGGVLIGLVYTVLPLTIGDGNLSFGPTIRLVIEQVESLNSNDDVLYPDAPYMTANLLICCVFAKMFTLSVSANCGFVGGFVFPIITIGMMSGGIAALYNPHLPVGMCFACFMAAVPAGVCPIPFTLLGISVYSFYFGLYQTVPIYIAIMTSYTLVCGTGMFRKLADRGDASAAQRADELRKVEEEKQMQSTNIEETDNVLHLYKKNTDINEAPLIGDTLE